MIIPKSERRFAELLSGVGAGVLGLGIGAYYSSALFPFSALLISTGMIAHLVGMYRKQKIDQVADELVPWVRWVYYLCWVILALGSFYYFYATTR